MFSTSGGYREYIGGISRVHQGTFSTSGEAMSTSGEAMSTSGDIMMHVGDIMSTLGDVQYIGIFNINQRLL